MSIPWASAVAARLFEWTWRTSLESSLLVVCVFLAQHVLGRWLSPRGRCFLSLLIVLRLLAPTVPASSLSLLNLVSWRTPDVAASLSAKPNAVLDVPAMPLAQPTAIASRSAARAAASLEWVWIALWLGGIVVSLWPVLRQHRSFSRWVHAQRPVQDAGLNQLLVQCKKAVGVSRKVELYLVSDLPGPALFGWIRPKLLLPAPALAKLDREELRLVLMHELAHVRGQDILLNWILILLRAWHWFNPLVASALKRLRADREAACDATVLERLGSREQRLYGETLLKLLEAFRNPNPFPTTLSVVSNKQDIKRRVTMIAHFKPSRPAAALLATSLVLGLCCFTFTRAADAKKQPAAPADTASPTAEYLTNAASSTASTRGTKILAQQLREEDERVRAAQKNVDELRRKLGAADGNQAGDGFEQESIRTLERDRVTAESRKASYTALLDQLRGMAMTDLRQILPTAVPDTLLNGLLERLSIAETELARISVEHGPDFPAVKAVAAGIANLNKQIDARIKGIFDGLRAQIASAGAAAATLRNAVEQAQERDAQMTEKYRPYFEAKRDLDTHKRIRETLLLRLQQEQIDSLLPP